MITICFTTRNRDLQIVSNCLRSLAKQSDQDFECFLVDYGSEDSYLQELKRLVEQFSFIQFISCPTKGQLWSKCRALNIALKRATQPFFVVGDIDLIFHPQYIQKIKTFAKPHEVAYFQYGYLNQKNTKPDLDFETAEVSFKGNEEATGNAMFPKDKLLAINGFDEYYHGWGAEDTDVQMRMQHTGLTLNFVTQELLVKHQWHPKAYRSKESTQPFHSLLERINQAYLMQTMHTKRTQVNQGKEWGVMTNNEAYQQLQTPSIQLKSTNSQLQFHALLCQMKNLKNEVVQLNIEEISTKEVIKNQLKKIMGKKYLPVHHMEMLNNLLLEEIIKNYSNCPYEYQFNRATKKIQLRIKL